MHYFLFKNSIFYRKRLTLLSSLCLCLGVPVLMHAQLNMDFQRKKEKAVIPFEYRNHLIIIRASLNGAAPRNFIFDTGAEHVLLTDTLLAEELQLIRSRKLAIVGADKQQQLEVHLVLDVDIAFRQLTAVSQNILLLEKSDLKFDQYTGVPISGIIGGGLFRYLYYSIDYRNQKIRLFSQQSKPLPSPKTTEVPLEVIEGKPYINTRIRFREEEEVPVQLLIDSGASVPLIINNDTHPSLHLPSQVIRANLGRGLGGYLEGFVGRLQAIRLPPSPLRNVVTHFIDHENTSDMPVISGRNGIIGNQILERYTISFDYLNDQAFFKANRRFRKRFSYDKSGLEVVAGGEVLDEFTIIRVIPGSPADACGLLPGDRILKLNNRKASKLSIDFITRKLRQKEGKKIKLSVDRNGEATEFIFHLKQLI
jgi:predicted aspartyl protease